MAPSQEMTTLADQLVASNPLTHRNPLPTLPYPYPARHTIRQHLLSLSNSFSSFHAFTCPFTHNDGRLVTLVRVEGSISIDNFTSHVSIWLVESYPHVPPLVYLLPPQGMVRVPKYEFIDSAGMVSVPYLRTWGTTASNLADLVKNMQVFFSVYHPFCSAYDPKDDLFLEIVKNISRDMNANEMELKQLLQLQSVLTKRNDELMLRLGELEMEKDNTEQELEMATMNADLMTSWLWENERRLKAVWARDVLEIEELFEISDDKGILDNVIADRAIDDTIYALDMALQEGCVPMDAYLKSIRVLSREQFFHRATQKKRSRGGARGSP